MLNNKTIVVSHKYTTTPEDYLVEFLSARPNSSVLQITHSFSDTPNRISYANLYLSGQLKSNQQSKDYINKPEFNIYLKELVFTLKSVVKSKIKWDTYIAIDGLCVAFGLILKKLNYVDKVIYWAMDYVPKDRFDSPLKNYIYKEINKNSYLNADEVWDISPRMVDARKKYSGIPKTAYKKIKIVPYGVWSDRIKKYDYEMCEKNTLVFMGHIIEKQGVQKVIEAIPTILKTIPDFTFKVIGDGPYLQNIKEQAKALNVYDKCKFLGKLANHDELEEEIAKSAVAIAPYVKELDTWTFYADPGKIKEYLASGVPVLLTDIPWNSQEIVDNKCGFVIDTTPESISSAVVRLLDGNLNQQYRSNAIKYAQTFDYSYIFNTLIQ